MSETPERPRPQYGEYAPEGPPEESPISPDGASAPHASPQGSSNTTSPQLDGVPHNLGVATGGSSSATTPTQFQHDHTSGPTATPPTESHPTEASPTRTTGAPVAGPPPGQTDRPQAFQSQVPHNQPVPEQAASLPAASNRRTDRIITIVLLVLGAFGALNFGSVMLSLGSQLRLFANVAGLENFTLPASIGVLQTVGALIILTIYAVTLLWSIARMRARKIAFWLPLAGGALAFIATMVISTIAIMSVPDLITSITPDQLTQILQDQMSGTPAG